MIEGGAKWESVSQKSVCVCMDLSTETRMSCERRVRIVAVGISKMRNAFPSDR